MIQANARFRQVGIVVALLLPFSNSAASRPAGSGECSIASLQKLAPPGTTIKGATLVSATDKLGEFCRVDATVATPGNSVDFRLGLPVNWNGKFFFQGVGGFAGAIGALDSGLGRGYASASTDTGHQGAGTDASWAMNSPDKVIDYAHRGTHASTVAAKSVTQAYYGKASRYAIFSGCSNGGRQALMEAQRYSEDFDGIIAGDPGLGLGGHLKRLLIYQTMLSSPEYVVPSSKLDVLSKAVLASCDASDGLADGLVSDPRRCRFDPDALKCKGPDGPDCLTAGQVKTVRTIYSDVRTRLGMIRGFPPGHENGPTGWPAWITGAETPTAGPDGKLVFGSRKPAGFSFQDGYFHFLAWPKPDPAFDPSTFDLERDAGKLETMAKVMSPTSPDLSTLQKRGAKLLLYHGWADPALSAYATIDYYNEVVKAAGGAQKADAFVRLFLVPGMHHCSGGPGPNQFDALTALEGWLEKGAAPSRLIATHSTNGVVDRTRPLCPEPQVARYVGTGSVDDASNFRCEAAGSEKSARR